MNPNAPEFVPQWPNTTPVERKVMAIEHVKAAVEHVNIAIGTKPPCAEDPCAEDPWSTFNRFACLSGLEHVLIIGSDARRLFQCIEAGFERAPDLHDFNDVADD